MNRIWRGHYSFVSEDM